MACVISIPEVEQESGVMPSPTYGCHRATLPCMDPHRILGTPEPEAKMLVEHEQLGTPQLTGRRKNDPSA